MRIVALLVVATAIGASGCGSAAVGPPDPRPGLTDDEAAWVPGYADWVATLLAELDRESVARTNVLGDDGALRAYAETTRDLRACRARLDDTVDDTPSDRLEGVHAGLRRICDILTPAIAELARPGEDAQRTGRFLAAGQAVDRAYLEWSRVNARLEEMLLARGGLPARGGSSTESRIEPVLTRAAAEAADGRRVEVRCWSPPDWERVLAEEQALTRGEISIDTVGAFAQPLTGTLHLRQQQCEPLARLAAGRAMPPDGEKRRLLAYAVGTLSHEIQHLVGPGAGEAETECAAVQHHAELAALLGATAAQARALASTYWAEIYPGEPDEYRSDDCGPGGELDQAPATAAWPSG